MSFDFLGVFSKQDIVGLRTYLQGEINKNDPICNNIILEINKLEKTYSVLENYASQIGVKIKWFGTTFDRRNKAAVDDVDSASLVQITKEPYYQNLKVKEDIEHRLKKIQDTIEQLYEKVYYLRISKNELDTNFEKINSLFNTQHPHLTVEQDADSQLKEYTIIIATTSIPGTIRTNIRVTRISTSEVVEVKAFTNDEVGVANYVKQLQTKYLNSTVVRKNN